ncbi:MAG TPA: fasciclin domain-containing protein [Candidatus Paceibacterota bacterium]|nr:fasciclin domain-containing protein [Candidatus Paceibacterota bacterium]
MTPPEPVTQPNIVETAVAADDFTTLVTAVTAAELAEVLSGPGPFTVFAPTDAAFAALPEGTVETLLQPDSQADLAGILTYHVVPGAVSASDLADGMTVETVNGDTITFGVSADGVTVNDANVVTADIEASNGIIHVIDTVLIPAAE